MSFLKKLVGTTLQTFIKNYTDKHLSLDILRGEVVLRGIDLNEVVLMHLLQLPPNLVIRSAKCGFLRLKVPWRKIRTDAVQVSIEVLIVDIAETAEPVVLPPMPPKLAKMLSKKPQPPPKSPSRRSPLQRQKEAAEPSAPQPPTTTEAEKQRKAIPAFMEAVLEGITVEITGVYANVSLLGTPEDPDARKRPNAKTKRRPLPTVSLSLGSLTVQSTNGKWEPVDFATARREGLRGGQITVRKEVKLGAVTVEIGKAELFKLHPSITHATIRRKATEAIPSDVSIVSNIPLVSVSFSGSLWSTTLAAVEDVLWCVHEGTLIKLDAARAEAAKSRPQTSTSPELRSATASSASASSGAGPPEKSSTPSEFSESTEESDDGDASELSEADLDIASLSKELETGSDAGSVASDLSAPPASQQLLARSRMPVIQFSISVDRVHVKWPDIAIVALTGISVSSTVEKVPMPADQVSLAAPVAAQPPPQSPRGSLPPPQPQPQPKKRHIVNTLVRCAIGALGLSVNPSATVPVEADSSVVYFRGDSGLPFIDASILMHRAPSGIVLPGSVAEITADIGEIRFIPDTPHLRRLVEFFSTTKLQAPPQKSDLMKAFSWLDTSKCKVSFSGILVDTQVEPGGPRVCAHAGPISLTLAPAPNSPLATFPPVERPIVPKLELPWQQLADAGAGDVPEEREEEEEEEEEEEQIIRHSLQRCQIALNYIWVGIVTSDVEPPHYFFTPFSIEAEVLLFQPVTLLCYAVQGRQLIEIDRGKFKTPEEMPAINATINVAPINFSFRQSKLHVAGNTFRIVADLIAKQAAKQLAAKALKQQAGPVASGTVALGKRLKMLRRVINARMASRIPCRAYADLKIAKTGVTISCSQAALSQTFASEGIDFLYKAADSATRLSVETAIETIARTLFMPLATPDTEFDVISIAFEGLEGNVSYQPPPLPTLAALISAEIQQQSSQSQLPAPSTVGSGSLPATPAAAVPAPSIGDGKPLVDATFEFHGYAVSLAQSNALPFGIALSPRHVVHAELKEGEMFSEDELRPPSTARINYQLRAEGSEVKHRVFATLCGVNVTASGVPPPRLQKFFNTIQRQRREAKLAMGAAPAIRPQQLPEAKAEDSAETARVVDSHHVTLDLELCDMEVCHAAAINADNIETHVRFVPQTEAVVRNVRERLAARISAVEERRAKELAEAESKLAATREELRTAERLLIDLKMVHASSEAEREQQAFGCAKMKRACATAAEQVEKLRAECNRVYQLLQAKFSDVPVAEFKAAIRDLSDKGLKLAAERDDLLREARRAKENMQKAAEAAQSELEKERTAREVIEKAAKEEREKVQAELDAAKAEMTKLRETLEARSQQLTRAQEALCEKQVLEEELVRLKERLTSFTPEPTASQEQPKAPGDVSHHRSPSATKKSFPKSTLSLKISPEPVPVAPELAVAVPSSPPTAGTATVAHSETSAPNLSQPMPAIPMAPKQPAAAAAAAAPKATSPAKKVPAKSHQKKTSASFDFPLVFPM